MIHRINIKLVSNITWSHTASKIYDKYPTPIPEPSIRGKVHPQNERHDKVQWRWSVGWLYWCLPLLRCLAWEKQGVISYCPKNKAFSVRRMDFPFYNLSHSYTSCHTCETNVFHSQWCGSAGHWRCIETRTFLSDDKRNNTNRLVMLETLRRNAHHVQRASSTCVGVLGAVAISSALLPHASLHGWSEGGAISPLEY